MNFKWNIGKVETDFFGHFSKEQLDELDDDLKYVDIVDFKCLNCHESAELETDIVLECFNPHFEDHPLYPCMHCNKEKLVPLDVYNQLTTSSYFSFKKQSLT